MPDVPQLSLTYSSALQAPSMVFALDGSASVSQASVADFPVTGATISLWLRTSPGQTGGIIFSYDADGGSNANRLWIRNPENLEVLFGGSSTGLTGVVVNDGSWHQIVVTIAPSDTTHFAIGIFLDGVVSFYGVGAITRPSGVGLRTDGALFLGRGLSSESGFAGQMSEFRLLDGIQSAAAVMTNLQTRWSAASVTYWALTSAQTSGTLQGGSFVQSTLTFRSQALTASWTQVSGATYDLAITGPDGWNFSRNGLPYAPVVVTGFSLNTSYTGKVRAVVAGVPGAWSVPATVLTLDLQQVQPALDATGTTLTASWTAIDQAQSYNVANFQDGGGTPVVTIKTTTTYDLSSEARSESSWKTTFTAASMGSLGPVSDVVTLQPVNLTFYYFGNESPPYLQASWDRQPNASWFYVQINDVTSGAPVVDTIVPGTQSSSRIANYVVGDRYSARVRPIGTGMIGTWAAAAEVTVRNLTAPIISSLTGDGTAHTLRVDWSYNAPGITNPFFNVELWQDGGLAPYRTRHVQGSNTTFDDPAIINGAKLEVRIGVDYQGSLGLWSAFSAITIGAPPQLQGVAANANADMDVTVTWTAVGGSGVTYSVRISGPGGVDVTQSGITGTSYTFPHSQTHVQANQTYSIAAWAVQNTLAGPAGTTTVKIAPSSGNGLPAWLVDPVDIGSGAYAFGNAMLACNGVVPLVFSVFYASSAPASGESPSYTGRPLGNRWNHTYNTRIVWNTTRTQVQVLWGSGNVMTFNVPSSVTGYYGASGLVDGTTLFLGTDQVFVVTTRSQETYRFTYEGRLFDIETAIGNHASLTYVNGLLHRITDPQNQYLEFSYDGSSYLSAVTDGTSSVRFDYQSGNLTKITDVMQRPILFTYTGVSLIETVTAQNGKVVCKNTYYTGGADAGRVRFQQDGRAVASGAGYGTSFTYRTVTESGFDVLITSITDRAGNLMEFHSIQANGSVLQAKYTLTDGNIRVVKRTYDGFANVLTDTLYQGLASAYADGRGNTTVYTYDGRGNTLTVTDPGGRRLTYTYDAANNITSVTDADGNTTGYHYEENLLTRVTPPADGEVTYEYWPDRIKGLVRTFTDSLRNTFQYEYTNGFLTLTTNPLGEKTVVEWVDGRPHIIDVRDAASTSVRRTTIDYWSPGWIKRSAIQFAGQNDGDAFATGYAYDAVGNIRTVDDAVGNTFTYEYDDNNYLWKINYPAFNGLTRHTEFEYTRIDQLAKTTYSPEVSNGSTWNSVNEMLTLTGGNSEIYRYSRGLKNPAAQGPSNWEEIETFPELKGDPATYTESMTTDPSGRVIAIRDRAGQVTDISYSRVQNTPGSTWDVITKVELPPAEDSDPRLSLEFRFSPASRITRFTNTAQKSTAWTYSVEHDSATNSYLRVATITDPANRQRVLQYDALGRLVYDRQGPVDRGIILQYAYDAIGRIVRVKQQKNASATVDTTFTYTFDAVTKTLAVAIGSPGAPATHTQFYDGAGNMIRDTSALGKALVLTYTPWGALATYANRRGSLFEYGFDLAGRLLTTLLPDGAGTVKQTLDGNGNRTQTQRTGGAQIVRTFDQWNRLLSRTDASGRLVSYAYRPGNALRKLTYPDGMKSLDYQIDNLGRLTKVTDWGGRATSYGYWPSGMLRTVRYWNGTLASYDYDEADNLTGIVHSRDTILIAKETVVLDAAGNPATGQSVLAIAPARSAASATFTFNAVNEIATWNGQQITYDDDGNILTLLGGIQPRAATYDPLNRLTALGADNYSYDDDGFRGGATIGGSQRSFVHDVASWQSPQVERADPYRAVVEYGPAPSPYGIAVGAPRYGTAHEAVGAAEATDRLIEIRDGDGRVIKRFIHGSLGLVGLENAAGDAYVAHTNAVGNTLALTDATGEIHDRYAYDAYGALTGQYGPSSQPFRYNGRDGVFDDGNGVLYMRGRSYSPDSQAFLQRDTLIGDLQFPQTLNGYSFVAGDPLRKNDPLGLALIIGGVALGVGILAFAASRFIPPPVPPGIPPTTPPPSTPPSPRPTTPPGFTQTGPRTFTRGLQTMRYRGYSRVATGPEAEYMEMDEFLSTRSVSNTGIKLKLE